MKLPRAHRPLRLPRPRPGGRAVLRSLRLVYEKAGRDEIFFLASAITFNVLLCFVPLLLLAAAALGYVVASSTEAYLSTIEMVQRVIPASGEDVRSLLLGLVPARTRFGLLGLLTLVWASTRLFGSLRTVLFVVFELEDERRLGIVEGKVHDILMVLVVGLFFVFSMALTTLVGWIGELSVPLFGRFVDLPLWSFLAGVALTFATTVTMFFILYRYLPNRAIGRNRSLVSALVSGVLFEVAKYVFVGYLARLMNFAIYGQFSTLILLLVWVYYSAVVFILGGEIAWLYCRRREGSPPRRRPFRRAAPLEGRAQPPREEAARPESGARHVPRSQPAAEEVSPPEPAPSRRAGG
ncbi:MAG: YihY/virulence factor BrkB family protein [Gemmatimonadota bacterium]